MYARMPTIFANNKKKSSEAENTMSGSAAYKMTPNEELEEAELPG